jgi:hypothetical protein
MSAIPPKADLCSATRDVRFGLVPISLGRQFAFDELILLDDFRYKTPMPSRGRMA